MDSLLFHGLWLIFKGHSLDRSKGQLLVSVETKRLRHGNEYTCWLFVQRKRRVQDDSWFVQRRLREVLVKLARRGRAVTPHQTCSDQLARTYRNLLYL
jgi:hypothetical protein